MNNVRWPPAEKTGRGSLFNRPESCPPDDPIGDQGTELTELHLGGGGGGIFSTLCYLKVLWKTRSSLFE